MSSKFRYPASDPANKVCTQCRQEKPRQEFSARGRGSFCKPCKRDYSLKRRRDSEGKITPEDIVRFWSRVNKNGPVFEDKGPCWVWRGAPRNHEGYGQFHLAGRNYSPHTVALMLMGTVVERPRELFVDHMCRNRMCCNPDHLRLVTPRINGIENNDSFFAKNAAKKTCKHGHDLTVGSGNVALLACKGPMGSPMVTRCCLTCVPSAWNNPRRIFVTV